MRFLQHAGTRKVLAAALLCFAVALLTSHFFFEQIPKLVEGDIATQDIEATAEFDYIDEEAWAARKLEVAAEQPAVYELDVSKQITLEHRINTAFSSARNQLETLNELTDGTKDVEALETVQTEFEQALGLTLRADERAQFIEAEWSLELQQVSLRLLQDSMQFYIIDVASEIPTSGQAFEVQRQFEREEDVVRLTDARNVKTRREVQQYVSVLASNLSSYPENLRSLGSIVARKTIQVIFRTTMPRLNRFALRSQSLHHRSFEGSTGTVHRAKRRSRRRYTSCHARFPLVEQEESVAGGLFGEFVVKLGLASFLVVALYLFANNFIRKFASSTKELEAMTVLALFVLLVSLILVVGSLPFSEMVGLGVGTNALWYATPLAGGAMVLRILTNSETTLVWTIAMALFLAFGMEQDVFFAGFFVVSGVTAAASLAHTRDRINLLRAGLQTGLIGAAVALLIEFYRIQTDTMGLMETSQPLWDVLFCILGGVGSSFLALGLLPLFEGIGFVTDYKMLELASLNHPLLRQLSIQAPGTYHHSMNMAQLSEAAAEAIGANALHAKIACYYHDIGKSLQPQFFIENQRGTNPHDNLEPHQSARVIKTHVVDGIAMAKQHGLPQPILDAIEMHHGTSLMKYFYVKALENAVDGEVVDEADFRYNGKRPSTREAGIIFLADRVEAACRTLKKSDASRLSEHDHQTR